MTELEKMELIQEHHRVVDAEVARANRLREQRDALLEALGVVQECTECALCQRKAENAIAAAREG